jgi:hypothetical protein
VFHLESSGTPLGLVENSQFTSRPLQLEIGDVMVMYTDGITETENPEQELWGHERLETLLRASRFSTPAQIVGRIVDEVSSFSKGRSQSDDMTLVVIGVRMRPESDCRGSRKSRACKPLLINGLQLSVSDGRQRASFNRRQSACEVICQRVVNRRCTHRDSERPGILDELPANRKLLDFGITSGLPTIRP